MGNENNPQKVPVDQSVWECNLNVYYYETADLVGLVSFALATSGILSFPY